MLPVGQLLVGTLADVTGTPVAVAISSALSVLCVIAIARKSANEARAS
jgi:hypothetical protein